MSDTMGRPGMVNDRIPASISRGWAKRAATLERRAMALLSDMLDVVGADDPLTDHADNIVLDATEIGDLLARGRNLATRKDPSNVR